MPSRAVENTRTFQKASLVVVMIQGDPTPPRKLLDHVPQGVKNLVEQGAKQPNLRALLLRSAVPKIKVDNLKR